MNVENAAPEWHRHDPRALRPAPRRAGQGQNPLIKRPISSGAGRPDATERLGNAPVQQRKECRVERADEDA
jgi:hypothetical protein